MQGRKPIAVLDANAFISMSNIRNLAASTRLITTEDVLAELKDLKTKSFVQNLPFQIETVDPDEKAVELVKEFAKKTGDIASLSLVDMQLIAVTYQIYKREGLDAQLRKEPPPLQEKDDLQEMFDQNDLSSDEYQSSSDEDTKPLEIIEKPEEEDKEESVDANSEIKKNEAIIEKPIEGQNKQEEEWISVPQKKKRKESSSESEGDDEQGWITTKNYDKKMAEIASTFKEETQEEKEAFSICLVSADFALQNVAVQMGIKLLSLDGRKINTIRRFIYECYLCWKQYRISDEKVRLCTNCGYNSLSKIAYSIDVIGNMILHRKKGWKPNMKILEVKERKIEEQERKKKHQHARRKKKASIFQN